MPHGRKFKTFVTFGHGADLFSARHPTLEYDMPEDIRRVYVCIYKHTPFSHVSFFLVFTLKFRIQIHLYCKRATYKTKAIM
jgi:hypothetical protein